MIKSIHFATLASALVFAFPFVSVHAGTLTYKGTLQDAGKPADGKYDMQLTLYSSDSGGRALGAPVTLYGVPVNGGNFSTEVDFGATWKSDGASWVATSIRSAGTGDFVALDTRTAAATDAPSTCNGTWALDGNTGNPSGSFLGNVDNQPLVFEVAGAPLGNLSSSGDANAPDAPNVVFGGRLNNVGNVAGATIAGGGRPVDYCGDTNAASCSNSVQANYGTVGGGRGNSAWGYASTIPGGADNFALGQYSFAAGRAAFATGDGSFVWADASSDSAFGTDNPEAQPNTFNVRATGGTNFVTSMDRDGHATAGIRLAPGSGSWSSLSDRHVKNNLLSVNAEQVLDRVADLPITTWHYIAQTDGVRHIGPMAQDFYAAFDVGEDNRHITEVDEGGVALAAIQGLNKKLETENASLRAELAALRTRVDAVLAAEGE